MNTLLMFFVFYQKLFIWNLFNLFLTKRQNLTKWKWYINSAEMKTQFTSNWLKIYQILYLTMHVLILPDFITNFISQTDCFQSLKNNVYNYINLLNRIQKSAE
jgi:hypothetical protein